GRVQRDQARRGRAVGVAVSRPAAARLAGRRVGALPGLRSYGNRRLRKKSAQGALESREEPFERGGPAQKGGGVREALGRRCGAGRHSGGEGGAVLRA